MLLPPSGKASDAARRLDAASGFHFIIFTFAIIAVDQSLSLSHSRPVPQILSTVDNPPAFTDQAFFEFLICSYFTQLYFH